MTSSLCSFVVEIEWHGSSEVKDICDLSRDNVPNASRSNAERNGKRTGDERLGKPFETGTVNGWTAN